MELQWLEDFQTLAQTGNFSKAAELRCVTQSAFSRRIKSLEEWVGTPLFQRHPRGCTLTAAGLFFHRHSAEIARQILTLREETRAIGETDELTLKFAVTQTLSSTFFPHWISGYNSITQNAGLELVAGTIASCEKYIYEGKTQFLITHHHPDMAPILPPENFLSRVIGHDSLVAVSAPDSRGQPYWQITEGTESKLPYLAYNLDSAVGRILNYYEPKLPIPFVPEPVMSCTLAAVLKSMIVIKKGIGWLPMSLINESLKSGELVRAFDPSCDIALEIRLFRPDFPLSESAERLWAAS